jgi:iduronate 2-sulfatase
MPNAWDKHLMPVGEWKTPVGAMHGLAHGETRKVPKELDVFQSVNGSDMIYPDGLIVEEGLHQLEDLTSGKKPFFLAIGVLKPHLPFGAPKKYLDLYEDVKLPKIKYPNKPQGTTTWHKSGEFNRYNLWEKNPNKDTDFANEVRKHYAACVSYADTQVGKIIKKLKETGAYENTIIVLWGDHGWNLGEHAIWGKHNLFEEGLRSPLIISYSGIEKPGVKTNALVETSNIFPTLCELTKVSIPNFVDGVSMMPIIHNPKSKGIPAVGYNGKATTLRTNKYRLTVHKNGAIELYDHTSKEKETLNIATENTQLVKELTAILKAKYGKELIVRKK